MIEMEFDKCSFSFYLLTVFLTFYSNDQNLGWPIPDTLQAHRELQNNYWTFNLVLNTYLKTRICPYSNFFFFLLQYPAWKFYSEQLSWKGFTRQLHNRNERSAAQDYEEPCIV